MEYGLHHLIVIIVESYQILFPLVTIETLWNLPWYYFVSTLWCRKWHTNCIHLYFSK